MFLVFNKAGVNYLARKAKYPRKFRAFYHARATQQSVDHGLSIIILKFINLG
ncbi:hypothetical protein GCM10009111_22120 [Colwellia asteriadis]|uniref:Uncharacterized protein n=1 Tax=Colwellia asteriadis TaxID=517723 RepID=A0ABP3WH93_9GAMM